jgi:N-acetyl-gamma-glutamyl-phosphate reductase
MSIPTAILGASGYAGGELIRLVDGHPSLDVAHLGAHRRAGEPLGEVHPHLDNGERSLGSLDPAEVPAVDLAFLALPHGASAEAAMALLARGIRVVDLGSDFRLDSVDRYATAYGPDHPHPEQLGKWAYGLPEWFGPQIAATDRTAAPGCYPTSAILAVAPIAAADLLGDGIVVVDSVSGASGAGRALTANLTFGAVDESVGAYRVLHHRHRPEMEQGLGMVAGSDPTIVFTPHLVPMQRGILSTCYVPLRAEATVDDLAAAFEEAYRDAPFVTVIDTPPQTRWVVGSNRCLLSLHLDERSATAVVLSAIDNLLKGAAGQAVQCANLMLDLPETAGLPTAGWMP